MALQKSDSRSLDIKHRPKTSERIMTKFINAITSKGQASITNADSNTLGKVYLVGAGPGAADLITVRGAKLLAQADIVFHDALVEPEMLALCSKTKLIAVGKRCGKLSSAQQFINKRLIDAAHQHQVIVRLKGGDPTLFGRADEEIQALKTAGIDFEVVPGITAALAGAASIGQSLTLRGVSRSVAFVTHAKALDDHGLEKSSPDNPIATPSADTLVYYMGRKDAAQIAQQLISQSKLSPQTTIHILEAVSTKRERIWSSTLTELANGKADDWFDSNSPALIMVGQALQKIVKVKETRSASPGPEIDNRLQDGQILANRRSRA